MKSRGITIVLLTATSLAGCATSAPPAVEMPEMPNAAAPPPAPEPSPSLPRDPGSTGATSVDGGEGLVRLCDVMRDESRMDFPGNAVAQARAREEHAQRRQTAESGRYVTVVPSQGFAFGDYDLNERRLVLDARQGFRLSQGAELTAGVDDEPLGFPLAPEGAERMLSSRAANKLFLRVVFRPVRSKIRNDVCQWVSGGGVVRMEIDVEALALLDGDGRVLTRGGTRDTSPELDSPVTKPQVAVNAPRLADGGAVTDAMTQAARALGADVLPCYQKALESRPNLRGTLVVALRVATDGHVDDAHTELSTLNDDALATCTVSRLGKARLGRGPARLSVPFVFESKDDR
jgi:hypothetical protein